MQIGKFQFKPGIFPTLVTLMVLPLLPSAGFWQLDRADQKYEARAKRQQNRGHEPVSLTSLTSDLDDILGRKVILTGHFDLQHQVLLDNQKYRNEAGYYVYTPMKVAGMEERVLVHRGWIPQGKDRMQIPQVNGPENEVTFVGRVDTVPSIGLKVGAPGEGYYDWPRPVLYLDTEWLQQQTGYHVMPWVVLQMDGEDYGLVRDLDHMDVEREMIPAEKHMSYAFQWFSLAAALVIIYLVVNVKRPGSSKEEKQ